ncbi:MAG TPA: arylesterase [Burkholderiales bacterium]|nr:arylesterase [Burkholderiales bacterium]
MRSLFGLVLFCALATAGAFAQAQAPVILVVGDSLSAGYGLPQGRGWVNLLQQRLIDRKLDYRVVNASISGDTTAGGRARLPAALDQYRPAIVIIELGANDGLRGQPIESMRENLTEMVGASRKAGARVLLIGMRIPPNYGQQYTRKFQQAFADVAKAQHVALVPFLLDGFAERRAMFQADAIHPTEQAQSLMLETVWRQLLPLLDPGAAKKRASVYGSRIAHTPHALPSRKREQLA